MLTNFDVQWGIYLQSEKASACISYNDEILTKILLFLFYLQFILQKIVAIRITQFPQNDNSVEFDL